MSRNKIVFAGVTLLNILTASGLTAQSIPDAGSILRDQKLRLQESLERQEPPPIEESIATPSRRADGVRVKVVRFAFRDYEGVATEAELQAIVANDLDKELSFSALEDISDKVTAYLKGKGWFIARAYLPQQDVTSGLIEIAITQGRSDGNINIRRDERARVCPTLIRGMAMEAVRSGRPINERSLERSVLLMNDLPGVQAKASVSVGKNPGTSAIDLLVTDGPLINGAVWGDNEGSRYTGKWRGSAMASVSDPFGCGDQLTFLATEAQGLVQGRVGYNYPLSPKGIRLNFAYTGMRYELGDALASLNYKGRSSVLEGGLSYPVLRSRNDNVRFNYTYAYKTLIDSQAGSDIHNKEILSVNAVVNGDHTDSWFSGGKTNWNVGVTSGSFHEANPVTSADALLNRTEGYYTRFNMGLSRLQRLSERVNLNLSWNGQYSLCNLDSSEKLSLGGPNGIRAYPSGEGAGDEGHLFNAEVRYVLPTPPAWGNFQFVTFYDLGRITLQKDSVTPLSTATNRNEYWLHGAGLGLNYTFNARVSLRFVWAHVIGENPGRSISGNNSDGLADKSRYWLQAMLFF
jgi:hemolysin activation/secretion protein